MGKAKPRKTCSICHQRGHNKLTCQKRHQTNDEHNDDTNATANARHGGHEQGSQNVGDDSTTPVDTEATPIPNLDATSEPQKYVLQVPTGVDSYVHVREFVQYVTQGTGNHLYHVEYKHETIDMVVITLSLVLEPDDSAHCDKRPRLAQEHHDGDQTDATDLSERQRESNEMMHGHQDHNRCNFEESPITINMEYRSLPQNQLNDGVQFLPGRNEDQQLICAACHRNSTVLVDIELRAIPDNIVRRPYGDMSNLNADAVACWHCRRYINEDTNIYGTNGWAVAWPAVLWTYLSAKKPVDPSKFSALLSNELRSMWKQMLIDNDVSQCIRQALANAPIFTDITNQVCEFDKLLHTDGPHLLQMQTLLNKTAFPTVVCPMGCNLFVDDLFWDRADLLPVNHYLKTFIPSFKGFKANDNYFKGARPDWPDRKKDLKWYVSPALVMDKTRGLCIVTCSKSVHTRGDHQYIHVPTHPILGHIPTTFPDHMAPAVVTPNLVRAGHSRTYNISYNVVKQKGDGRGLSTFSLRTKSPQGTMTRTESQACSLTLHERSDVRYFMSQSETYGRLYVRNVMQQYPPAQEHVVQHLQSGTYIHVRDSYELAKSFHSRKTVIREENCALVVSAEDHVPTKSGRTADSLIVVHRVEDKGHPPFKVPYVKQQKPDRNYSAGCAVVCALHCLVHCRPLHRLLVRATSQQLRPDPIIITLQSLCIRMCNSTQSNFMSLYPMAKLLGINASLETPIGNVEADTSVESRIANLLCHHCPHVSHQQFHRSKNIDISTILSAADNDVVILTRHVYTEADDMGATRRIRVAKLPLLSPDTKWSLLLGLTVHCPAETPYSVDVAFRWTSSHTWQKETTAENEAQLTVGNAGKMALMIYSRTNSDYSQARNEAINWCGGQTKLRCADHTDVFLIREQGGTVYRCCYKDCNTPLRWRCPRGLPNYQCDTGLCLKHGKQLLRDDDECGVIQPHHDDNTDSAPNNEIDAGAVNDDNYPRNYMHADTIDLQDNREDAAEAADMYVMAEDDFPKNVAPLTTSSTLMPLYMSETSQTTQSTLGHFVLNDYLRVLTRVNFITKPAVGMQKILQHICAVTPADSIPLLYPEAVLFPTLFWSSVGQSIVGALPSALYTNLQKKHHRRQLATLQDHMHVRLRDNSLLTSHNFGYLQWTFDILLNHQLNYNSAAIAVKKGLEHLRPPNIGFSTDPESAIEFDELDSRQVNRLAALMKDVHGFDYFITATCNDSKTFGVAPITRAIEELYRPHLGNPEYPDVDHIHQSYCVIMCRAWERTSRYFLYWLQHSPQQPCGEVETLWARYEFQSDGSPGNRPHIHIFLKVKTEDEKTKLRRIRYQISNIFSKDVRMDIGSLLEDGFINNLEDYSDMYALCKKLQVHDCNHARSRCQMQMADGTWRCHVQQHPPAFEYNFDATPNLYDRDVLKLLEEIGLAKRDVFGNLKVSKKLVGGKYTYPERPKETFVPTIPWFWLALQSCTNVQLCDTRFQMAYMCKYAAGVDEKREADFEASSKEPTNDTVHVQLSDPTNKKTQDKQ